MRRLLIVLGAVLAAALPAAADPPLPVPLPPDTGVGFFIELHAPTTFSAGTPLPVSGVARAAFWLPVVVEVGAGLPNTTVDILVDDQPAVQTTTRTDGSFTASLTFDASKDARVIRAVIFRGSLLESSSDPITTNIDRFVTEITIEPGSTSLSPGGVAQLRAWGLFNDGRLQDITERATWTSSNPGFVTVSNADGTRGQLTGVAPGTSTVTASLHGVSGSSTVTVSG